MIPHDLEKAWAARALQGPIYRAPTFVGDRLVLGAQTVIAVAHKATPTSSASANEHDTRMVALLSAFYGAAVSNRALAHLRRALEKRIEGDALLASTHLALAGHWPVRDPAPAAKRILICDSLMSRGTAPETILAALGFDPQWNLLERYAQGELRNPPGEGIESGRWTRGGAAPSQNEVVVGDNPSPDDGSLFSEKLSVRVVQALSRFATRSSVPWIAFDTLFIPSADKTGVTQGDVPDRTDLQYNWDKPAGQVVFRVFIDGHWIALTAGRDNLNQFYRDADGNIIARAVGDGLIINLGALDRARERLNEGSGGQSSKASSSEERRGPKLCPEPSTESNKGWSANSSIYQQYVSGLGAGLAVLLNGVSFDGCDPSTGFMLDGKARYGFMLEPNGSWKDWTVGAQEDFMRQMTRQADAAALDGRQVVWHAQELGFANALRGLANTIKKSNLHIMYDPGPQR